VVVHEPARTFTRHQVHVNAAGHITFGRGRPIRLGYVEAAGTVTAQRTVFASQAESRADNPAQPEPAPAPEETPELPAAEPEPTTEPEEDRMSLSDAMRSKLGLGEGADETAALAAIDALQSKAEQATSSPDQVAASTAAVEKAEAAQQVMKEELTRLSTELATIKASAAATVKASYFDGLLAAGKLKPADRPAWEARYDRDPEMVAEILGMRAEGSEVPVMASGVTGPAEPAGTSTFERDYEAVFGPEKASA